MQQNDALQMTGPQGFGSRPTHSREPSIKTSVKAASQGSRPESEPSRGVVPVVSMRRPDPNMRPQHFTPKVISYDLNAEHRQDVPLRFGKFIYERDCHHEGKFMFSRNVYDAYPVNLLQSGTSSLRYGRIA